MDLPSTFGTYRLLEALGEGGSGQVFKAMDLRLERVVALKLLKVVDERQRGTLIAEAKTACQLQHPHIAVIYEAGEVNGEPYIAMEFVEGKTLRSWLKHPQPEAFLRQILIQAASALVHAHQKGIIHRDIKPDNLLVHAQGDLKLLDFGVAKRALPTSDETSDSGFTITGETMQGISLGTPAYMSPEQAHGHPLGPATDQFSLGLVLLELALGFHPFRKPTLLGTLQSISADPAPDLARARPDLPPSLTRTLQRMLEKDPAQRFPSMEAVLAELGRDPKEGNLPAPEVPLGKRRSFLPWVRRGTAALLVVGLPTAWWLYQKGPRLLASTSARGRRVVAILPLELQGIPREKHWLGTSFQDAVATGLLRRGDLLVLDRMRVAEATAEAGAMNRVSELLGADLLLTGSLQAAGDRLRLSLRLIQGKKGEVLDQITFEGTLADTLSLEDDLGKRVPALFGASTKDPFPDQTQAQLPRTRECYIRGMELVEKASYESSQEAIESFEEAIRSEPNYAPAHAGLAWALGSRFAQEAHLGKREAKATLGMAIQEGRKALVLDPSLSMAFRALGVALERSGDHTGAQENLRKAVDLDPADYRALGSLADNYAYQDEERSHALAQTYFKQALELHPRDWWINFRLGVLLQNTGDLKAAAFHADRARQLEPGADYAHLVAGISYLWLGDLPTATQRIDEGLRHVPDSGLLQVTQVLCDYTRNDLASFHRNLPKLSGKWAESHPISVLLKGLEEGSAGHTSAMRDRFQVFAEQQHARALGAIPPSERRVLSVNAYHMARALAQGGQAQAARLLLDEAERMQPGKWRVAARDPLLQKVP